MKKINKTQGCGKPCYVAPEIELVEIESAAMLCASNEGFGIGDIPGQEF